MEATEGSKMAFSEYCRNVTYMTGVSAALELLLLRRAGFDDPRNISGPVLSALAAIDQALIARVQFSWLHWDLVTRAEAWLERELEAIQWKGTAESGAANADYESSAAAFLPDMGAQFFPNLYAVLERTHEVPFWARCFSARTGLIRHAANPRTSCFSPLAALHPVYYEGAEPFVNYGSLGALHGMGTRALAIVRGVRQQKSDDYRRNVACLEREHGLLDPGAAYDVHGILRAALSVRAALQAVQASSQPLRNRFERQTFFKRVCLVACSRTPDQAPSSSELPPRVRCNMAVRHTRLFHAAFRCDPRRRLARVEACQLV
ncbi:uncharacterized protein LOC144095499 [Amblyomma americanum]